ncbi:peroxisome proliferator-activated receptor gamma coactivator 1-alpha-like isoform X7 [Brienomyrus brachyistius]|uniref:peroxisome proliferator-activated receptor gamma coactivator 1-alpha-like isoform X7 n=1 Tax=Brienomyrus brachyistius TaxID=42636 RepID=UPI0020B1A1E4|nr:peroxisome proliferator-activated receptor gamma coactivator 1-alpha-like isoform X7 [Brienomyrus brachyistius]
MGSASKVGGTPVSERPHGAEGGRYTSDPVKVTIWKRQEQSKQAITPKRQPAPLHGDVNPRPHTLVTLLMPRISDPGPSAGDVLTGQAEKQAMALPCPRELGMDGGHYDQTRSGGWVGQEDCAFCDGIPDSHMPNSLRIPSPIFPDSGSPLGDSAPFIIRDPPPFRQAVRSHPDDQALPLLAKPTTLPLPLTPESPNDHKESPFENKTIDRTLSVELSGTPGLTPPTTPPHKASQENPFKASIKTKLSSCGSSALVGTGAHCGGPAPCFLAVGPARKDREHTELFAQLSRVSAPVPPGQEERRGKRTAPRVFSDHDYCQFTGAKRGLAPCQGALDSRHWGCATSVALLSASPSLEGHLQMASSVVRSPVLDREAGRLEQPSRARPAAGGWKPLEDIEIRAELNKHFGHPKQAMFSEEAKVAEDHYCQTAGGIFAGLPLEGVLEDSEEEGERLFYPWEDSHLGLQFDGSPSCSPSSSPSRSSVSPSKAHPRSASQSGSRSRSRSRSSSASHVPRRRTPSRSPYSRSRSRSPHACPRTGQFVDSRSRRAQRSLHAESRSQSRSPSDRKPGYDSYEEYRHEHLRRQEYRQDCERRESEGAEQREKQRQKAIEERRVVYVGRLRSDITWTELKRRFEVFGEMEECTVNLRDDGDNFGFITYRYTCDAMAALENGHTLRKSKEPHFELCFGGLKQFCKTNYTDLDSHCEDFDPTSAKSKYDCMDFDSLLQEAQSSLKR